MYVLILIGMEILSGVPYTDIAKSSNNMLFGVLIPVVIGSIFLTIVAIWSGWWKDVWRDQYKIKDHAWMHIFLILVVIGIIATILSGSISSLIIIYNYCINCHGLCWILRRAINSWSLSSWSTWVWIS